MQGYNGQASSGGGQGQRASNQNYQPQQPQYANPGQDQYSQGGQQYSYDEQPPPVKQYPRGGSLSPSAYGGGQGQSRNYPSDQPQGGLNGQSSHQPAASTQSYQGAQQGSTGGAPGPFHTASQRDGGFPDNTDSEASDADSVRQALAHARLRSQELGAGEGRPGLLGASAQGTCQFYLCHADQTLWIC